MFPIVTIIMPVRNEADHIERSLEAVLEQDYPSEKMEAIVADGMSSDGTREIVQSLRTKHSKLRLIKNPGKIVSTGLNLALRQARGKIIIRVDGHCEIAPDYVLTCVKRLLQEDVDGVGGPIETIGETFTAQSIALAMSSPFGVGNSAFRTVKDRMILVETVAFAAYRRETIQRVGLFDEELVRNQDDEYNYRLCKAGGKILLVPDIRSRYYSRSSLRALWRQYFQYGFWKVRVFQKHPRQMRLRQFVPPAFIAVLLGLGLLSFVFSYGKVLLVLTGGVYLVANLSASVCVAARHGWTHLFLLPFIFGILHFGYGLGFLMGLVRFANRWGDKHGKVPDFRNGDGRTADLTRAGV